MSSKKGKIRVGKYDYKSKKMPEIEGYDNILIHTTGQLSPYTMKDEYGTIMENFWQFSKIWEEVEAIKQPLSQWDKTKVRWEWPTEKHLIKKDGKIKISEAYYKWQNAGFQHNKWVRYPNGFKLHREARGSVYRGKIIDYVTARKKLYYRKYREIALKTKQFAELKRRYEAGENLQIVEVDGPKYGDTYPYNRVNKTGLGSLRMNKKRLIALINNPDQAFGHGYCVAALLLGIVEFA